MKRIVCLICAVTIIISAYAQTYILITTDKTTSLIFPYPVKHVDRGSKDILVQPVKDAENILLLKAATNPFSETNLSVVTSDGSVYSFAVSYGISLDWIHYIPIRTKASISTYASGILDNPKTINGIKDRSWDMLATVAGIYIKDNIIYYQLNLVNQSPIDYDIDFFRLYIRDKKKNKRTATQENEIVPLNVAGNTSQVKANQSSVIVLALEKFTIPDAKYLAIEIGEKRGGRNLFMKLNNKKIIQAIPLPDLR